MNILHIGLMINRSKNIGLSKAFRDRCDKYEEFPISDQLPQQIEGLSFVPDLVFCQIQSDKIGNTNTCDLLNYSIDSLRKKGSFIINWTGDKRDTIPIWMHRFNCDITAFSSQDDVDNFKRESEFLQIGIDPEIFHQREEKVECPEIVYMGNNNNQFPLAGYRRTMISNLKSRYGEKFGVYGVGYLDAIDNLNADGQNPIPMQTRESRIYNSCKIAISVSNFDSPRYHSDRLLRCMGSGAFTLSHNYINISQDYEEGKHLAIFRDWTDLYSKIDYYLENEYQREDIAENGYYLVHSTHLYKNMVEDIINLKR